MVKVCQGLKFPKISCNRKSEHHPFDPLPPGGQTAAHPFMIDIRDYPETIESINAALNSKEIAEIKYEPKGLAVVVIRRTVKSIEKK
jgi:hypothetical protein